MNEASSKPAHESRLHRWLAGDVVGIHYAVSIFVATTVLIVVTRYGLAKTRV
jgi:hypothetical protein